MYAIIKTGGKQYRVSEGDIVRVEKLAGDVGATVKFDQILMVGGESAQVGRPLVEGAIVEAKIERQARARKVLIFKKKKRTGYHKKQGHRQYFTELKITGIQA
ncbi:50S ribosomal protein L21 [Myxococcota bacterium]|nr:50S ribosomal protein L21 [Myxococcota bacterium]